MHNLAAERIKKELGLQPHPEGGWYAESFRDKAGVDGRAHSTAIYFLLEAGDVSHWHRVTDAVEVWHFYAGAPLALTLSPNGHDATGYRLGPNLTTGEHPQIVVPANCWQTATSLGPWTLVGCTVSPGFDFASFELAPPDWKPTPRPPRGG
ncbi:cupin domain-containing protein [Oricola sp.]|uniref:cupin domain-containing protein n=1 Tax=Oricola sp. TaxID=1979950 RepID=UPI0025E00278|nr:cupin domain-containing protein [Oricola sp.]MCI5075174.1 cupin domain-containing protein [Oricola sp.]